MATLTRRKIVQEDISFDTAGTDATDTITRPNGTTTTGKKVNAGDLPLKAATQVQTGESNVDDAIAAIKQTQDNTTTKDATTTQKGLVQLATSAETQAGAIATKANTPAGLKSLTSTEARKGLIERATVAEAEAGTDTERAVTPAGVKAAILKNADDEEWGKHFERCPSMEAEQNDTTITLTGAAGMYDDTGVYFFSFNGNIEKDLTAYWAEGTGLGGCTTGINVVQYIKFVFCIYNKVTGVVDAIIDDNPSGSNILATVGSNWVKRRVGGFAIYNGGGALSSNKFALDCMLQNGVSFGDTMFNAGRQTFNVDLSVELDFSAKIGDDYFFARGVIGAEGSIVATEYVQVSIKDGNSNWYPLASCGDDYARIPFKAHGGDGVFKLELVGVIGASKTCLIYINEVDFFHK